MRKICVLLVAVLCCSITFAGSVDGNQSNNGDKEFILKQKDLLRLFKHVLQTSYYKDQAEIAKNYSLEDNLHNSTSETAATKFIKLHKIGLLLRGSVFSIFNDKHRQQAVALFDVLFYAKDWDNFYKIACWAREYVNEAMFVYAMHVAVMHRADTKDLVLPPIYEIYPHFFVNKAVIDKANDYKIYHGIDENTTYHEGDHHAKSNLKYILKEQNDLAYFHDDVRSNANYYYFHIAYPFWMDSNKYGLQMDIRGELFYFVHQQILARYYLERLTEGYGPIDVYNWQSPIKTGYSSKLGYPNGVNFPSRPTDADLIYNQASGFDSSHNHFFQIQDIEDYESRIRTDIDFGHILTLNVRRESIYQDNGFNVLANLVECNADSKNTRYFGPLLILARQVLGYTFPSNNNIIQASALEHFETSLRDPMFYQFYNRIIHYFAKYKNNLPEYNETELKCSGVTINNVTMSTLNTFFEKFEFEISNALYTNEDAKKDGFQAWAHQYRLNHEPFTYTINVTSDTVTNVAVRVFIGPKYDNAGNEIPFNENRLNFVEFDKFEHSLEKGENIIIRNSTQGKSAQDRINFRTLYQDVSDGLKDKRNFKHNMLDLDKSFVLPKGESNGRVYKFFIHIGSQIRANNTSGCNIDGRSFGYPLDRQISDEVSFFVPNSYLFEEKVYYNKTHVI